MNGEQRIRLAIPVLLSLLAVSVTCAQETTDAEHALPPAARDVVIPARGYLTRQLTKDLFLVTDGIYQALFLITGDGVVVVDAPPSLGKNLLLAIAETTPKPVTHLIYTHAHHDHIGAAHLFDPAVTIIANSLTRERLERVDDPDRPYPDETFETDRRLVVGGEVIELSYKGNNHAPGNIFVYFPEKKTLMLVDVVYPGWVPFTNLGMSEDIGGTIAAHDRVLDYDFEHFVGGHLGRPGTREDVEIAITYLRDLKAAAEAAMSEVNFADAARAVGITDKWLLVRTHQDEIARRCAERMIASWARRLGGVESNTPSHCWMMQEHLSINGQRDF